MIWGSLLLDPEGKSKEPRGKGLHNKSGVSQMSMVDLVGFHLSVALCRNSRMSGYIDVSNQKWDNLQLSE